MESKKLKSLIATIFMLACGVIILLALVLPFYRYEIKHEEIKMQGTNGLIYFTNRAMGIFSSDIPYNLSEHFTVFPERKFLLVFSDIMIVLGVICIIATAILAVIEALGFKKEINDKLLTFKKWFSLVLIIISGLFILISLIFFVFGNHTYKLDTGNSGYMIRQFKGHVGWWFIGVCSMVAAILGFRKGLYPLVVVEAVLATAVVEDSAETEEATSEEAEVSEVETTEVVEDVATEETTESV